MNKYRCLSLALAMLALLGFTLNPSRGEDRRKADSSDKGSTTKGMHTYTGKIVRVDADKHTLVLGDIRGRAGKGTGAGTGAGAGAASDRTATGAGEKARAGDRTMTFQVSDKARISLDGKDAKLSDLKAGLFARVSTSNAGSASSGTSGTTRASGDAATRTAADKTGTGSTAGVTHTATRVEAFTKAPTGTGTGTGTGKGTSGTDRNP